jgi:8-oxo-dGTP diphosphatase
MCSPQQLIRVTELLIRVVAAVVSCGDRLLVCQRPSYKRHGGLWEFPGGKCEPGESDLAATRRELHEELGVDVLSVGAEEFAIHDEGSPFLIAFLPTTIDGEPTAHEHEALRWGTLVELATLPLAPSDRRYVEHRLAREAARA